MDRFQTMIQEIRQFEYRCKAQGTLRKMPADPGVDWPAANPVDIVLMPDLALELGRPDQASLSFLIWTAKRHLINDDTITLIGPDIQEVDGGHLPLGKIVLAATDEGDDKAVYERYRQMDQARFVLSLKGYMLRATSQYLREWSRISTQAVRNGFSFHILGSALARELKTIEGVNAAEVIFITQSEAEVRALADIGAQVNRTIQAMHKRIYETEPDCDSCEYQDVCGKASELKALRRTLAQSGRDAI